MDVYLRIVSLLNDYFHENTEELFLKGGCFYLADYLHQRIRASDIMINRYKEHCATQIGCHGIYDITGRISQCHFQYATPKEIAFMRKNYVPKFDGAALSKYLDGELCKKS